MLVQAPVWAELVPAPVSGQVREAAGLVAARGWAERPVRQRLVQVPMS